jgi:hypothetical protein
VASNSVLINNPIEGHNTTVADGELKRKAWWIDRNTWKPFLKNLALWRRYSTLLGRSYMHFPKAIPGIRVGRSARFTFFEIATVLQYTSVSRTAQGSKGNDRYLRTILERFMFLFANRIGMWKSGG